MRSYRPDYVSARQYREILASNRACAALVQASQLPWIIIDGFQTRFPRIDDGQLARILSDAQREAAKAEPEIAQVVAILRQGEQEREQLTMPRWQAGYDLAIGQALAVQVRTRGYNTMLALAKQGMRFKTEGSDTWELRRAEAVASTAMEKDAQAARSFLRRVVAEHEGTPWALHAAQELRVPMGWEWTERFTNVAARLAQASNNNVPRPQPQPAPVPAKPRRPPPDL
jgi:hypothetical protein